MTNPSAKTAATYADAHIVPDVISAKSVCDTYGISARTLDRWIDRGCPVTSGGGGPGMANKRLFRSAAVAGWVESHRQTSSAKLGKAVDPAVVAMRMRKELAGCKLLEIRISVARGEMVDRGEAETRNFLAFTAFRNRLDSFAVSVSPLLEGQSADAIRVILAQEISSILSGLAKQMRLK